MNITIEKLDDLEAPLSAEWYGGFFGVVGIALAAAAIT